MEITETWKEALQWTADLLVGTERRQFYARVVRALGRGGQRRAQSILGWSRTTSRKGEHELRTGIVCQDACKQRGAKPIEVRLPNLRTDIRDIVEQHSQTDPTFETTRLYRRLTAAEVRTQLLNKGYVDDQLPSEETIRTRLNLLGFWPAKVRKSKPKKRFQKRMPSLQG